MIQLVQDLFTLGRVKVLSKCKMWIKEHRRYTTKEDSDDVIKKHDHSCDDFQYYVVKNRNKLGLGD